MNFKVVFDNSDLGTNDVDLESITLYPNPTQTSVTIISQRMALNAAKIYDIGGRKVSEGAAC